MAPTLSVVIPTYNEAANIGPLLVELRQALAGRDVEFIVVDDDSRDGTPDKARMAEPTARVIVRKGERGLATAVLRGIREAHGTFVAVMDADFQHPPAAVRAMLDKALATDADLVVGSRYAKGGSEGNFGFARRTISKGARGIAQVALPPVRQFHLSDPMSGLFLVRRDRVPAFGLKPTGYKVLLEILGKCDLRRVEEVGYLFQSRRGGASKLGSAVMVQYLLHVLGLGLQHKENQRLLRFLLVGASGVAVNLGCLFAFVEFGGLEKSIAVVLAAEISILTNFFLNDAFTFADRHRTPFFGRIGMFQLVSLSGLVANFLAFFVLYFLLGIHYLVAEALAIVCAFSINYAGNLKFTYGSRRMPAKQWVPIVVLIVASSGLYFTALDSVPDMEFDESYYLAVAHQLDNGVLMDPCNHDPGLDPMPLNYEHPPLAKLIMAASVHAYDTYHGVFAGCRAPDTKSGTTSPPCFVGAKGETSQTANDPNHDLSSGAAFDTGHNCFSGFQYAMRNYGNPYAWRAPSALFGVLTVAFAALAARRLFGSVLAGTLAGSFVLLDNLVMTSSRIALLDIFATGFMVIAVYFATSPTRKGVFLTTIFLGLGFSCKFYVLFAGPPILLLSLWTHYRAGVLRKRRFDLHLLAFPLVPIGVFLATYTPWLVMWTKTNGLGWAFGHFLTVQGAAFHWDTQGVQTHQYLSPPSEWLSMVTPMNYEHAFTTYPQPDGLTLTLYRDIYAMGNPALWWAAAIAVVFVLVRLAGSVAFSLLPRRDVLVMVNAAELPPASPPRPMATLPLAAAVQAGGSTRLAQPTSAHAIIAPASLPSVAPAPSTLAAPSGVRAEPPTGATVSAAILAFTIAALSGLAIVASYVSIPGGLAFSPQAAPGGPLSVALTSVVAGVVEVALGVALLRGSAFARPAQVMLSMLLLLWDIALMVPSGEGVGLGLLLLFASHAALLVLLAGPGFLKLPRQQQALLPGVLLPLLTYLGFFALHSAGRSMFIFYMTLIVPLMAIALGGTLAYLWQRRSPRLTLMRQRPAWLSRIVIPGLAGIAAFVAVVSALVGEPPNAWGGGSAHLASPGYFELVVGLAASGAVAAVMAWQPRWFALDGRRVVVIAAVAVIALAFLWFLPVTLYLEIPRDGFGWQQMGDTPFYYPGFGFHRIMGVVPWMHECGNRICSS